MFRDSDTRVSDCYLKIDVDGVHATQEIAVIEILNLDLLLVLASRVGLVDLFVRGVVYV